MLISYSKDCSLKLWSFAAQSYPGKVPVDTIYDHESKIRSADTKDYLLGAFDSDGKLTIRDLRNSQEVITSITASYPTKHQHFGFCDSSTFVLGNGTAIEIYNIDGSFINTIDLHEPIIFIGIQGSHLITSKKI